MSLETDRPIGPFFLDFTADELSEFSDDARKIVASGNLILGEYTVRFEEAFARYVGARYAVTVNSGSSALEFLCRLKRVADRTVLVPTNTNFATVAAVLRAGGKVEYLDMVPETFAPSLDLVREAVARSRDCAGVLWVHIGGVISPEFPDVVAFCRTNGLWVVEDAAHAHGSRLGDVYAGSLADGAAFSFFATKVMTTGEGGMITTNDEEEYQLAQSFRNQGKRGAKFGGLHHDFGNSSRMTELQCAIGLLQLRKLPAMLKRRRIVADRLASRLDIAGLSYCSTRHMSSASHYKFIVHVPANRNVQQVKEALKQLGVVAGGGVYEIPSHCQPVFSSLVPAGRYPGADTWCARHVCPPVTSGMTESDAAHVADAVVRVLE